MGCLTEDIVVDFLEGRLAPREIARMEAHVDGCTSCLDLLATATRSGSSSDSAAGAPAPAGDAAPASLPGRGSFGVSPLLRGSVVGRYLILGLVGRGGMGEVYAAYDPELDRRVAVKLLALDPANAAAGEGRARLLREAKAIARLSHPNVVVVYDAGTWEDRLFIAMEFVEGDTLSHWLKSKARRWQEIRDVFLEAGRGLAAAHAAGLVHRDFKPQNVMVGRDGKVRVTDFGLVRDLGPDTKNQGVVDVHVHVHADDPAAGLAPGVPLPESLESSTASLTRTGVLIGTPSYMAPEQFRSEGADARTDQFSFCVALYEGLYRQRPFAGDSVAGLKEAVLGGRLSGPPEKSVVPTWLRRVVTRGLRPEREARYRSMEDLLDAMARDPTRRARRFFIAAVGAVALVAGGIGAVRFSQRSERLCRSGAERLMGIWETSGQPEPTPRRNAVREAFLATKLGFADQTWQRVAGVLDRYADRWTAAYADACEATHVRHEQSAEALDLRMGCLGQRIREMKALTDVFVSADAPVMLRAADAARSLGDIDPCANIPRLRAVVPPPSDAKTTANVEGLRSRFASVKALRDVGRIRESLAAGSVLLEDARTVGYKPLIAETLALLGWLQTDDGADEAATERTLTEAFLMAEAGHDDEVKADAVVQLVGTYSASPYSLGAARWNQIADAVLERIGPGHERLWSWLLVNRGNLRSQVGDFRGALQLDEQAVALKQKILGPDNSDTANSLDNLAVDLNELGEHQRALATSDQAIASARRAYGDAHPWIARFFSNRGEILNRMRRYEEARVAFEDSIDRWKASLGLEHRNLAFPLTGLGETDLAVGRPEAAVVSLERALVLRERSEPEPIPLAETRFALARALWQAGGDQTRARALATKARAAYVDLPFFSSRLGRIDAWLETHGASTPRFVDLGSTGSVRAVGRKTHSK